jgi:hypothetical protein
MFGATGSVKESPAVPHQYTNSSVCPCLGIGAARAMANTVYCLAVSAGTTQSDVVKGYYMPNLALTYLYNWGSSHVQL